MAVEPLLWIHSIMALSEMVKAVADALRSNFELARIRKETEKTINKGDVAMSKSTANTVSKMAISEDLLQEFVKDIEKARRRFIQAINDPGLTKADLKREEKRARKMICKHMKQVQKFNDGELPGSELNRVAVSFRCFKARTESQVP